MYTHMYPDQSAGFVVDGKSVKLINRMCSKSFRNLIVPPPKLLINKTSPTTPKRLQKTPKLWVILGVCGNIWVGGGLALGG